MLKDVIFLVVFLLLPTTNAIDCYDCSNTCRNLNDCKCDKVTTKPSGEFYCSLTREFIENSDENLSVQPVQRNATNFYVYEPFYVSVDETIRYNKTSRTWENKVTSITFGCQEDRCNRADLLKNLPRQGFSLSLPTNWLDESLIRPSNVTTSFCHQCPDEVLCSDDPDFIDTGKCHGLDCATRCDVTESFQQAESPTYCFQSFCQDEVLPNDFVGVTLRAIYYLRQSKFELTGIDIFCQADDCSQLEMFKTVREKLEKDLSWVDVFTKNNGERRSFSTIFLLFSLLFYSISF